MLTCDTKHDLEIYTPAHLGERRACQEIEEFARLVERRFPGRVVLIRHLAVHWSLNEAELADRSEVLRHAGADSTSSAKLLWCPRFVS